MSAVEQLHAAFPQYSREQLQSALKAAGGSTDGAVEVLLSAPPAAARTVAAVEPPNIRTDPRGWFRHFDRNGNGLEKHEVVDAVVQTFGASCDRASVRDLVENLWLIFDTDGSGSISLSEFTKPDGLHQTLLAQMADATQQQQPQRPDSQTQTGYRPGRVPETQQAGSRPGRPSAMAPVSDKDGPQAALQAMFPQESSTRIKEALARCRGDTAAAADWLMRQSPVTQQPAQPAPQQAVPGYAQAYRPGTNPGGYPTGAGFAPTSPPVAAPRATGRPPKLSGRRRALLIGINYFGTQAELRGCINDVKNIENLLVRTFGWPQSCIRTLTDDDRRCMPTRANITMQLRWLVQDVQPGDVLFFHFSGHGAQEEDPHGYEEDGMNETIVPVDFKSAGQMTDDEISEILVRHLPEGVRLTAVMDCCHSGTGLDLPFAWNPRRGWKEETNPFLSLGDVQLFSGCEDDDTSSDASTAYGAAGGAMTTAFCDVLRQNPGGLTYAQFMQQLTSVIHRRGFSQHAQLTSSQRFEFDRPFLLDDIIPNSNASIGRVFRRKFPPRPRQIQGPLADMLGLGAAVVGGLVLGEVAGDVAGGLLGALFG